LVSAALTTGLDGVRAHALSYGADPVELDRAVAAVRAPDHRLLDFDPPGIWQNPMLGDEFGRALK